MPAGGMRVMKMKTDTVNEADQRDVGKDRRRLKALHRRSIQSAARRKQTERAVTNSPPPPNSPMRGLEQVSDQVR